MEADDDLEDRHRALIERDRWIGLEAEAASARAHAARLVELVAAQKKRLEKKNLRIKQLNARVRELEGTAPRGVVARLARTARRGR